MSVYLLVCLSLSPATIKAALSGPFRGELFVVGSAAFPVDAAGAALAYPPIHIHHFHLSNGPADSTNHRPMIEAHGDSACHSDQVSRSPATL